MKELLALFDLTVQDAWMIPLGAILFVALWRGLAKHFFLPYIAVHEKREQATSGAADSANQTLQRAAALNADYEAKIIEVRVAAMKKKGEVLHGAEKKAASVLSAAEQESREILHAGKEALRERIDSLRTEVLKEADRMAEAVVDKVKRPPKIASRASY